MTSSFPKTFSESDERNGGSFACQGFPLAGSGLRLPFRPAGYGPDMGSATLGPSRRPHAPDHHRVVDDVVHAVADELHHLKEIEEKGDSPIAALIVLGQVVFGLFVVVAIETTVAMAFYFGWL